MFLGGTAKRVMKRVAITRRVNLAINALNSLWFGGEHKYKTYQVDDISHLPIAQQDSLRSLIPKGEANGSCTFRSMSPGSLECASGSQLFPTWSLSLALGTRLTWC